MIATHPSASSCGGLTQADVGGLGEGSGGLVGPEAVLLPQLVPLLQRQDDRGPVVPLLLAVLFHIVEQVLPLSLVAPDDTCTDTHETEDQRFVRFERQNEHQTNLL